MWLLVLTLITGLRLDLSGVSTVMLLFYPPFHTVIFEKKSLWTARPRGEVMVHFSDVPSLWPVWTFLFFFFFCKLCYVLKRVPIILKPIPGSTRPLTPVWLGKATKPLYASVPSSDKWGDWCSCHTESLRAKKESAQSSILGVVRAMEVSFLSFHPERNSQVLFWLKIIFERMMACWDCEAVLRGLEPWQDRSSLCRQRVQYRMANAGPGSVRKTVWGTVGLLEGEPVSQDGYSTQLPHWKEAGGNQEWVSWTQGWTSFGCQRSRQVECSRSLRCSWLAPIPG